MPTEAQLPETPDGWELKTHTENVIDFVNQEQDMKTVALIHPNDCPYPNRWSVLGLSGFEGEGASRFADPKKWDDAVEVALDVMRGKIDTPDGDAGTPAGESDTSSETTSESEDQNDTPTSDSSSATTTLTDFA